MGDPLIHTHFASFHIQERVKPGGMAIVYKAFDKNRQKIVALKILQENLAIYEDIVLRFKQEAMIASRLQHPHIVSCYDYGEYDGRLYIAMEYMPGGSLADELSIDPMIMIERTITALCQIADALDYAHSQNVVHRDLKLGNILISSKGEFLLTDFGIARLLDATQYTRTGQPMPGTAKYMSPEQAAGRTEGLDHRSDIYSLAVIAYLLTTGRYPFTGVTEMVVLNQHIRMPLPQPTQVNPNLPSEIDAVLLKGLAKRPDQRYQSAGEFAQSLQAALTGYEHIEVEVNMRADNPAAGDDDGLGPQTTFDTSNSAIIPSVIRKVEQPQPFPVLLVGTTIVLALLLFGSIGFILFGRDRLPIVIASSPTVALIAGESTQTPTTTDTPAPTTTDTLTPTQTRTNEPTPTPTLPYHTLSEVLDVFLRMPSNNRFDCPMFIQAYQFLEHQVATNQPGFEIASTLIDEEFDPLRQIYINGCHAQEENTRASIDFTLFADMNEAIRNFQRNPS
jgi:serine/threonine protein kinase